MSEIQISTFGKMQEFVREGREALVLLGAGEPLTEWDAGINLVLHEGEILAPDSFLTEIYRLESTGGRTDLVFMIDKVQIEIGKLAIWRLGWGSISWLSDFVVNYADHYGVVIPEEEEEYIE